MPYESKSVAGKSEAGIDGSYPKVFTISRVELILNILTLKIDAETLEDSWELTYMIIRLHL
jgi:hypothetical protein